MKLGSAFLEQARTRSDSSAAEANRLLQIGVETGYHKEHNVDDSHSTIRASGSIYEQGRGGLTPAYANGVSVPVFFVPADFGGNGTMTWTPTQSLTVVSYCWLAGVRMQVDFAIGGSVIGGALNTMLTIKIPGGWFASRLTYNPCRIVDNGVAASGIALVTPGGLGTGNVIQIFRNDVAAWTATPIVQGQISFEARTA